MKTQLNPNIKAHLLRGAFYVLLVVAICATPFAQAQRRAIKQSAAKFGGATKKFRGMGNALPANIIVVTNTNDSGPGSLRDAIAIANDGDTIDATGISGSILLTSGQLNVDKDVTITGPGAENLTVDGNAQSLVFYLNPGKTVAISGLTITNGSSGLYNDGGIYNDGGALTVSNCAVSANSGGGIANAATQNAATMTVSNCSVSSNSGSGIVNSGWGDTATMTVSNCTISGNFYGGIANGGFFGGSATMTLSNCIVSDNLGSGIANGAVRGSAAIIVTNSTISGNFASGVSNSGTVTITECTVSGNSGAFGGGIQNVESGKDSFPLVIVSNSTISGNSADFGGGIYNASAHGSGATVRLNYSTISDNSAGQGGGIYNDNAGGSTIVEIGSTILKAGTLGENIFNSFGTVTSLGYNMSSDDGGGVLTGPGDQINTDPMLGPLQDNGGPTFTNALLPDSPAINSGDPGFTPPPFFDQRGSGFDRVVNGQIDIGSFELQAGSTPTPTPTPTPTLTATATATPRLSQTPRPRSTPYPRPTP
jgi:hypothetical protein